MIRPVAVAVALALIASSSPARAANGDPFDGSTVSAQYGAGIGGGLLGGAAGGLAGILIGGYGAKKGDWGRPLVGGLIGAFVGGEVGIIIGVQYAGDAKDGTGRGWATTAGGLGGLAVGGLSIYFGVQAKLPAPAIIAIAAAFALSGPVVGYHLSADERAAAVPHTVPLIALAF